MPGKPGFKPRMADFIAWMFSTLKEKWLSDPDFGYIAGNQKGYNDNHNNYTYTGEKMPSNNPCTQAYIS
jgi:hypothetical protein